MSESDLPEDGMRAVETRGIRLVVARHHGLIYALADSCAHLRKPLSDGCLEGNAVRCPWHGSLFALADSHVLERPSTQPQTRFDVRQRDGRIEVRARS